MNDYIITLLNGMEVDFPEGYELIDANKEEDIRKLMGYYKVVELNVSEGEKYGLYNRKCIDHKTGDYSLIRNGKVLIEGCKSITPITKVRFVKSKEKYGCQKGILYCELINGDNYFYCYQIETMSVKEEGFMCDKVNNLIFNNLTGSIVPIKNIFKKNELQRKVVTDLKEEIKQFINNYPISFTTNQMRVELINANVMEKKDVMTLMEVIDSMYKNGSLTYTKLDGEIYYRKNNKKTKSLKPSEK